MRSLCCYLLLALIASVALVSSTTAPNSQYVLDDSRGPARVLDGIGGLSGGGATSVFIPSYPEPQRSEILDFLFKPKFGASLHLLKVEIGGDGQSTDGAESSHMHNPWEENYERGYEWWLMKEAKARNPNIKLYGLSWLYPQWVACVPGTMENCTNDIYTYPEQTARYITKWVSGAKNTYGLDIDYIGSWNERPYNTTYLKLLRTMLDEDGFSNTKIVAPDSTVDIGKDILADPDLAKALYAIGKHYPGTESTQDGERTGKPIWASEDDSTYNNDVGAGCWARIINQNYVNGNMTSTINWNLAAGYMKGTRWYRAGLLNAMQPWNGAYGNWNADGSWTAGPMIWASAHTTQFTEAGEFAYLHTDYTGSNNGTGCGHLALGGSYVTLKNFATGDVTIVIEKMSRDHSMCVRPELAPYNTSAETASFKLSGGLASVTKLNYWLTHWAYYPGDKTVEFEQQTPLDVVDGVVTVTIPVDSIITLTTVSDGHKGTPSSLPPQSELFPTVYSNDFEDCPISREGEYFADQNGIWECIESSDASHGIVMQQKVPLRPVTWGGDIRPHSLIGHRDAKDLSLSVDAYITEPGASVSIGVRMQGTDDSVGIIFAVDTTSKWGLYSSISNVGSNAVTSGTSPVSIAAGEWHSYTMSVQNTTLNIAVDGHSILSGYSVDGMTTSGHALIGTIDYGHYTQFDNFKLVSKYTTCDSKPVAGSKVSVVDCSTEVGLQDGSLWNFAAKPNDNSSSSVISLRSDPSLCVAASSTADDTAPWYLQLAPCNSNDPLQMWSWHFDGIAPDLERSSWIYLTASQRCLDIYGNIPDIGAQMDAWPCNGLANQAFFYDFDAGQVANEATATCLGVC